MWASNNVHIKVVQVLLDAGVDLSKRKPDGKRAVDIAASKGRREVRFCVKLIPVIEC